MGKKNAETEKVAVELDEGELAAVILALACYMEQELCEEDGFLDEVAALRPRLKLIANERFGAGWATEAGGPGLESDPYFHS